MSVLNFGWISKVDVTFQQRYFVLWIFEAVFISSVTEVDDEITLHLQSEVDIVGIIYINNKPYFRLPHWHRKNWQKSESELCFNLNTSQFCSGRKQKQFKESHTSKRNSAGFK